MRLHVIKVVFTILFLIKLNHAFYKHFINRRYGLNDDNGIPNVTKISNVNIDSVCDSRHKKCLWRCCPPRHTMESKLCTPAELHTDFADITVYDSQFQPINKSLESTFQLVPGILTDELFKENCFDYFHMPSSWRAYLMEDGNLYIELPNTFERWLQVPTDHFCVGSRVRRSKLVTSFWVELETQTDPEESIITYMLCAIVVSTVFLILTILPYSLFQQLRDGNALILIVFISLLIVSLLTRLFALCTTALTVQQAFNVASIYHFSLTSSFCWTNIMFYRNRLSRTELKGDAFDTKCDTIIEFLKYSGYAIGLPSLLVKLMLVIDDKDMSHVPWFVKPNLVIKNNFLFFAKESLLYLYTPLATLLTINWIICIMNVVHLYQTPRRFSTDALDNQHVGSPLNRSTQYAKLLVLLTCYCIMHSLLAAYRHSVISRDTEVTFTMCIGPVIFITFVFDKHVKNIAKQYCAKCRGGSKPS